MFGRKKKQEVIPVWEREEEYWAVFAKFKEAKFRYLSYEGNDEEERERLESEWLKWEKLYTPLYQLRDEWLEKTNSREKVKEKDRLTKNAILMAVLTAVGMVGPSVVENRGIIMKGAKDGVGRAWNGLLTFLGMGKKK